MEVKIDHGAFAAWRGIVAARLIESVGDLHRQLVNTGKGEGEVIDRGGNWSWLVSRPKNSINLGEGGSTTGNAPHFIDGLPGLARQRDVRAPVPATLTGMVQT